MKILLICVVFGVAFAEKPAPYPARGWKPQGQRLELPTESRQPSTAYGTPIDPNRVEITTISNEYGPPPSAPPRKNNDDFLQVLPAANSFSQFRQQQDQSARFVANGQRPFLLSPQFAPQFPSQREQLREQQSFGNPKNDFQRFNVNFGRNGKNNFFNFLRVMKFMDFL
jgi:hypothetical protein